MKGLAELLPKVDGNPSDEPRVSLDELIAQQRREEEAERQRARIEARHKASGVPARFQAASFDGFERRTKLIGVAADVVHDFVTNFTDHLRAGRCLILAGPAGTGKTHLACAAIRMLCDQGRRAQYIRLGDAIRRLRDTWRKDSAETESEVLCQLLLPDLLVIDEVGVQYGSEGEKVHAFDIIDGRYNAMRPTIVITNCKPDELLAYLGERVVDRLLEDGGRMLVFDGKSNRTRAK
ncbi:MAG TPA: ATP-binding protein [Noviherbaspirillum sp.]